MNHLISYLKDNHYQEDSEFDALLHINTSEQFETYVNHHSNKYEPTQYLDLLKLTEFIKSNISLKRNDMLLDIGSGMMRVPIFFHAVIGMNAMGIELNKQLYNEGLNNMRHYGAECPWSDHKYDLKSLNMNIVNFEFSGNEKLLFFFNPFSSDIFRIVMYLFLEARYKKSVTERTYIILYYPEEGFIEVMNELNLSISSIIPLEKYQEDKRECIHLYEI